MQQSGTELKSKQSSEAPLSEQQKIQITTFDNKITQTPDHRDRKSKSMFKVKIWLIFQFKF